MRLRIALTVEIEPNKIPVLVEIAKTCGHDYDHVSHPRTLIRRYLESKVTNAVTYCHEQLQKD